MVGGMYIFVAGVVEGLLEEEQPTASSSSGMYDVVAPLDSTGGTSEYTSYNK